MNGRAPSSLTAVLARVWDENRQIIRQRLEILGHAAAEAGSGGLTPELRSEALAAAHKLAGSLGMFGLAEAGQCAARVEVMLESDAFDSQSLSAAVERLNSALPLEEC
jgi:HPt (histidine-containing phosphotransfer) domain-containing protein